MFRLKNWRISRKLFLILLFPVVASLYFAINRGIEKLGIFDEMNSLEELTTLASFSSTLIHELQKERGASAGFLGSKGEKFKKALPTLRLNTDKRLLEFKKFLERFNIEKQPRAFRANLNGSLQQLDRLQQIRKRVNHMEISIKEEVAFYTSINNGLLDMIDFTAKLSTDTNTTVSLVAYINLLRGKESAGLERAVLSSSFAANRFLNNGFEQFMSLMIRQETYHKIFMSLASKEDKLLHDRTLKGKYVDEVERIRKIAINYNRSNFKIRKLQDILGYGGLVYQFKNHILRQEQKYADHFMKLYNEFEQVMHTLDSMDITKEDRKNLKTIKTVLKQYRNELNNVNSLIRKGLTPHDIDKRIRINDKPAVNAINALSSNRGFGVEAEYWFKISTGRIDQLKIIENYLSNQLLRNTKTLKEQARRDLGIYLFLMITTLLMVFGLTFVILSDIHNSFKMVTKIAESLSDGDMSVTIPEKRDDEMGQLLVSMGYMISRFQAVVEDIQKLNKAASQGDLQFRIDRSEHRGDFATILEGMNKTLDQVTHPLNVASDYMEQISRGEIPDIIREEYSGDFKRIKDNLNRLIDATHGITSLAQSIAAGDLRVEIRKRSEKDQLIIAIQTMVEELSRIVSKVKQSSEQIGTSCNQLESSSKQLSMGATQQAASVEEASSSIMEMTENIQQNAKNAEQTEEIAKKVSKDAQTSGQSVSDTVVAMRNITGKISIVQDIAVQTNLLALNAAIEAARSGEQGRGFAVVSSEIRKLAERVQSEMVEINQLSGTSTVVAEEAGDQLTGLLPEVQQTAELVQDITTNSKQQAMAAEQINLSIQALETVIRENLLSSKQVSVASTSLSKEANQLRNMISFFQIK